MDMEKPIITVNQRYRNTIKDTKTYPGADCDTDHNLLVSTIKFKLKTLTKKRKNRYELDFESAKNSNKIQENIQRDLYLKYISKDQNIDHLWRKI